MTISPRFSCNPLSSLPLHRSEAPLTKRRKLNEGVECDKVDEYNSIRPMTIDCDEVTASSACGDEGTTMAMMEVEQSDEDFVEMLLKDFERNGAIAISLGAIQESCLSRGIQLSHEARTEVTKIVSKYWE